MLQFGSPQQPYTAMYQIVIPGKRSMSPSNISKKGLQQQPVVHQTKEHMSMFCPLLLEVRERSWQKACTETMLSYLTLSGV